MSNYQIPSYEELFGDLDFTTGDEYRSVLSPAAYLVDIMDLKDWKYGAEEDAVDDRRSDIAEILLDTENTITEIPFLDIANGVMEKKVVELNPGPPVPGAYDVLSGSTSPSAAYPFNVPFMPEEREFRAIMDYFPMKPYRFYSAFTDDPDTDIVSRELCGLSPKDVGIITLSDSVETEIKRKWGMADADLFTLYTDNNSSGMLLENEYGVGLFRKKTGLSFLELRELLFQDLSDDEIAHGVSRNFFINKDTANPDKFIYLVSEYAEDDDPTHDGDTKIHTLKMNQHIPGTDEIEECVGETIPVSYFDRIHRLIRIRNKLGLSFGETDLVIRNLCGGTLDGNAIPAFAFVKYLKDTYELSVDDICAFFAPVRNYGDGRLPEPANPFHTLFDRGYGSPVTGLDPVADASKLRDRIKSCLGMDESDLSLILEKVRVNDSSFLTVQSELANDLSALYRISMASRIFELSIDNLCALFDVLDRNEDADPMDRMKFGFTFPVSALTANAIDIIASGTPAVNAMIRLIESCAAIVQWMNESDLSMGQLKYLCAGQTDETIDLVLSGDDADDLFRDLAEQAASTVLKNDSFQSALIDPALSEALFAGLVSSNVLTNNGVVRALTNESAVKTALMAAILTATEDERTITPDDMTELGITGANQADFLQKMSVAGYTDAQGILLASGITYFSNETNRETFTLAGYEDKKDAIFTLCAQKATAYLTLRERILGKEGAEEESKPREADDIALKINLAAVKQASTLYRILGNAYGLPQKTAEYVCGKAFAGVTVESVVFNILEPVIAAVETAGPSGGISLSSGYKTNFENLQRYMVLISITKINQDEISTGLQTINPGTFTLNQIRSLQQFKSLCREYSEPGNSMLDYFGKSSLTAADLAAVTGWPEAEITYLVTAGTGILTVTGLSSVQAVAEISDIKKTAGIFVATAAAIKTQVWNSVYPASGAPDYATANTQLREMLKAHIGAAEWKNLAAELNNRLNVAKRDVLVPYLLHKMVNTPVWTIENPRDLYEYFLLDVEMGEESTASRIQEAMMCMQLFYHRFRLNLEALPADPDPEKPDPNAVLKEKIRKWWPWMKNYRVWEANRKVFLYPENYIRPELRDTKSDAFKQLEEALLQGEIDSKSVDQSFREYLDKFAEVSRLIIAGGYVYQIYDPDLKTYDKKILIFGRGRTQPRKCFYMTGDIYVVERNVLNPDTGLLEPKGIDQIAWSSWKELGITINADRVFPVYAFNRVFVFWFEIQEKGDSDGTSSEYIRYEPVFYYSFLNLNGDWVAPQVMVSMADEIQEMKVSGNKNLNLFRIKTSDKDAQLYRIEDPTEQNPVPVNIKLTTKQLIESAVLDITNPHAYKTYHADECIYLTFEVGRGASNAEIAAPGGGDDLIIYQYEGKFTSDLAFTECTIDKEIKDRLVPEAEFPIEKFGIWPKAYKNWKGYFENTFAAPWFSFDDKGGTFLTKPEVVPDTPVVKSYANKSEAVPESMVWSMIDSGVPMPDEAFREKNTRYDRVHLFYNNETIENGNPVYEPTYRYGGYDSEMHFYFSNPPVAQNTVWGMTNEFYDWNEDVASAVNNTSHIYLITNTHYNKAPNAGGAEERGPISSLTINNLLSDTVTYTLGTWGTDPDAATVAAILSTCKRAFLYNGNVYLVTNGATYYEVPKLTFLNGLKKVVLTLTFTSIDSICIQNYDLIQESTLLISSGEYLFIYDCASSRGIVTTLAERFGSMQTTPAVWVGSINQALTAMTIDISGNLLLFYKKAFVELKNVSGNIPWPVARRWGNNAGSKLPDDKPIEAAFIDNGNIYFFRTDFKGASTTEKCLKFLCQSKIPGDEKVFYDADTPFADNNGEWKDVTDLSSESPVIKKLFSIDTSKIGDATGGQSVVISKINATTAFELDGKGGPLNYLLVRIGCNTTITKYRWRWYTIRHRRFWGSHRTTYWYKEYYNQVIYQEKDCYIRFKCTGTGPGSRNIEIDEGYPKILTAHWTNMPGDFNNWVTSAFKFTERINNENHDVFYLFRDGQYVRYDGKRNFPKELEEVTYNLIRLNSNTSEVLNRKLLMNGIGGMLSLNTQMQKEIPLLADLASTTPEVTDEELTKYYIGSEALPVIDGKPDRDKLFRDLDIPDKITYNTPGSVFINKGNSLNEEYDRYFDYNSINGQYYWEIFFHAPFLIAQTLNTQQKFDEARVWYEYVFDPTEAAGTSGVQFWKFMPFHWDIGGTSTDPVLDSNLYHAYKDPAQLAKYMDDPFDPHAIAALRQVAYRKAIVMGYIDNIIDWGDMLFGMYTRESINEARMLYVLAYELLGRRPENLGEMRHPAAVSYRELKEAEENQNKNQLLLYLENAPGNGGGGGGGGGTLNDSIANLYFYVPENRDFIAYWERVEDRLFKIRNSLNLDGVKQALRLFEPPIEPMALVRAIGEGVGLSQAITELLLGTYNAVIPHYRFSFVLAKAKELAQRLAGFGQSYLSALEKKDAEELSQLRNTHEKEILDLTLEVKEAQLEELHETLGSMQANLRSAQTRLDHYTNLISKGLSNYEAQNLVMLQGSFLYSTMGSSFKLAGGIARLIMQSGNPMGDSGTFGGKQIAPALEANGDYYAILSSFMSHRANVASILGGHQRRAEEWGLQNKIAQCDTEQIAKQINGTKLRISATNTEIEITKRQIKHNRVVDTFMKSKFTGKQLYGWMASKLAGLYFQTYQLALDLAKGAQRSFLFELGLKETDVSFISSYYWDSLKKGLCAGEKLLLDLDRMDKGYMEKNHRRFEITKTVSLAQIDPVALLKFKETRRCDFTLTEQLFDYDFPGHYCRQIKSVSITFPAVTGPYDNINATLTQLSHRTLIDPDKAGLTYLLNFTPPTPPASVRTGLRSMQQIALSRGVNDAGLFQLNFQDERYLPFEGTGAVSTWRLELNGYAGSFDVESLTDVIIKVDYTAQQGGESFAAAVKKGLKPVPSWQMFDVATRFSDEWNAFMENPSDGVSFTLTRDMLTGLSGTAATGALMRYELTEAGKDVLDTVSMTLEIGSDSATLQDMTEVYHDFTISVGGSQCSLTPPASSAGSFTPENIRSVALVLTYDRKVTF